MLRHREPGNIPRREVPREGMEKVVELPVPLETKSDVMGEVSKLIDISAVNIANQYGHVVDRVMDNAKLNDIVLRAAMQLPLLIQERPSTFRDFLERLTTRTTLILGNRKVSGESRSAFVDDMKGLERSVYQISSFVRESRKKNPDWRFGTSVWLDVLYGYDLLRAWPVWVPEKQRLDVFITGYQAKASAKGVPADEIRELPSRYAGQNRRAARELEFDPDWVFEKILSETDLVTQRNVDLAMKDTERARQLLGSLAESSGTPFEQWRASYTRAQLADRFSSALGLESGGIPKIAQRGTEINYRFLVDTESGTKLLTEEEASQYGKKAS